MWSDRRVSSRRLLASILVGAGLAISLPQLVRAIDDLGHQRRYETLADRVSGARGDPDADGGGDRDELPGNAVAWLSLCGTPIDYPVAREPADDPGYFLTHDLWGEESGIGCPYMEFDRSTEDAGILVFGHHCSGTTLMFSPIAHAGEERAFAGLCDERLRWKTRGSRGKLLVPLCALTVDGEGSGKVVGCSPPKDTGELQAWLIRLARDAGARRTDWEELIGRTRCAVSLVTCSSDVPGRRERTIFVCCWTGETES